MTQREAFAVYKELAALERLEASIQRQGQTAAAAYEWRCCLTAIRDRVRFDRYVLSLEDPILVDSVREMLRAEQENPSLRFDTPSAPEPLPALPPGARVH